MKAYRINLYQLNSTGSKFVSATFADLKYKPRMIALYHNDLTFKGIGIY